MEEQRCTLKHTHAHTLAHMCTYGEGAGKGYGNSWGKIITKCHMAKETSKPRQEQVPACTGVLERPGKPRHLGLPGFSEEDEFLEEVSLGDTFKAI